MTSFSPKERQNDFNFCWHSEIIGTRPFRMLKLPLSKKGLLLSGIYLGVFFLTGIFALCVLVFNTKNSEFSGIFSILVTLPWSFLFLPVEKALGYVSWYEKFAGTPFIYGCFALLGMTPGALLNTILLYFTGKLITVKKRRAE